MSTTPSGPAYVATVSFLAARAAPTGGFWIALAGGVALARVAERRGARHGFGASIASMLESVAILGPARLGVPLTQAATAPIQGRLEARSVAALLQVVAVGLIRLAYNTAATAFFIWVIIGGLDAYAGTYDAVTGVAGVELGATGALVLTVAGLIVWAVFASGVQVSVYRRGLRSWPDGAGEPTPESGAARRPVPGGRFDPRVVAVAAAVAFAALLASTAWPVLAATAIWLALAWFVSRGDTQVVPTGLVLTGMLAGGAFVFTLGGGLGLELALRRAGRAALLVLVATWLRSAAGAQGLREVFRRVLRRLRRLPALPEASRVLDEIGSEGRLLGAVRSLGRALERVPRRPIPVLDAVLGWVARESAGFRVVTSGPGRTLRARRADWALLGFAAVPALALVPAA